MTPPPFAPSALTLGASVARAATIQSAPNLYGVGSAAGRVVAQAAAAVRVR